MKRVNPNIEILGEYKNAATKILCRCKKDGYVWEGTPNAICHGVGCPKCNSSKGEMAVEKYLKDNNLKLLSEIDWKIVIGSYYSNYHRLEQLIQENSNIELLCDVENIMF